MFYPSFILTKESNNFANTRLAYASHLATMTIVVGLVLTGLTPKLILEWANSSITQC